MERTTLPERTVDVWLTSYLVSRLPRVEIWAPTQRMRVDFDLSLRGSGKLFILECKAPVFNKGDHWLDINVGRKEQLWRYCTSERLAHITWYVLPSPPYPPADARARGSSLLPELASARVAGHRWGGAPCEDWFHLVPARDLYEWLRSRPGRGRMPILGTPRPVPPPKPSDLVGRRAFSCADLTAAKGPASRLTLARWIDQLKRCFIEGARVQDGLVVHAGRLVEDGVVINDGVEISQPTLAVDDAPLTSEHARAVFVPASELPGWNDEI